MKIYFAGSIRGGRDDAEHYKKIITFLKKYGEVVTEHIGEKEITAEGETESSDKYIHDRDLNWLRNSDVIVAEVTTPSLGVGYEIGIAVKERIPVIALFRNTAEKRLSAMIKGCDSINVIEYSDIEALFSKLGDMLKMNILG